MSAVAGGDLLLRPGRPTEVFRRSCPCPPPAAEPGVWVAAGGPQRSDQASETTGHPPGPAVAAPAAGRDRRASRPRRPGPVGPGRTADALVSTLRRGGEAERAHRNSWKRSILMRCPRRRRGGCLQGVPMPAGFLAVLALILVAYVTTAELGKRPFDRQESPQERAVASGPLPGERPPDCRGSALHNRSVAAAVHRCAWPG